MSLKHSPLSVKMCRKAPDFCMLKSSRIVLGSDTLRKLIVMLLHFVSWSFLIELNVPIRYVGMDFPMPLVFLWNSINFWFTYFTSRLLQKYCIARWFYLAIIEGWLHICAGKQINILHGNAVTNIVSQKTKIWNMLSMAMLSGAT